MYLLRRSAEVLANKTTVLNASYVDLQINDEPTAKFKPKYVGRGQEFRFS